MSKREQAADGCEDGEMGRHDEMISGPMMIIQRYSPSFILFQKPTAPGTRGQIFATPVTTRPNVDALRMPLSILLRLFPHVYQSFANCSRWVHDGVEPGYWKWGMSELPSTYLLRKKAHELCHA
jgi:hypothetical protein